MIGNCSGEGDNLGRSICDALQTVILNDESAFDAYCPHMRDDEFRFECNDIVTLQYVTATRGYDRKFVDLNAYSMTYETCMLAMSHKIGMETSLLRHVHGGIIEISRRHYRLAELHKSIYYIYGALMGIQCQLLERFQSESAAHIGHISGKIATQVHHNRAVRLDKFAAGTSGDGRVKPGTTHGKIIRRRHVGIIARNQATHMGLHGVAADAELPEVAVKAQSFLYLYLKLYVGHALTVEMRDAPVDTFVEDAATAELLQFGIGLDRPHLSHQSRAILYLRTREDCPHTLYHIITHQIQLHADGGWTVKQYALRHLLWLAYIDHAIAMEVLHAFDKVHLVTISAAI